MFETGEVTVTVIRLHNTIKNISDQVLTAKGHVDLFAIPVYNYIYFKYLAVSQI